MTPLHVQSGYSLLRGPTGLDALIARAVELGHAHLAVTDVNGLYGATFFDARARQAGLRPIVGAELRDDRHAAVALVSEEAGYENLCRILTRLHCGRDWTAAHVPAGGGAGEEFRELGDLPLRMLRGAATARVAGEAFRLERDLPEFLDGLHLITEDPVLAGALAGAGVGPGRLWLGLDPATQSPARVLALSQARERLGLKLVATGKAMFTRPDELETARLLAAMRTGATFDSVAPAELPHPRAILRSERQLRHELARFPGALAANRRLTEECSAYRLLPREAVFPAFECPNSLSAQAHLRGLCYAGMQDRYGWIWPKAVARMNRELTLIERMGFSEYFLVVWDIVQYARRQGAPVAGRGSGASSIVAYLLGITNVCPLALAIPFERFLHEGRPDFPDLDVDFCWRIRDDVIDYAFQRWGADRVAMVCMHGTFQEASALRETAKAMGLSDRQISKLDDRAPGEEGPLRRVARLSRRVLGLPTHLSVHPGGIVIGRKTLDHHAPIQPSAKGVLITQYDKRGVEDVGLVKIDLLGNRSLSTIRYTCELIARRTGERLDVESLPRSDPATIRRLQSAETVGCNQLESPAMRHLLKALRPKNVREVMKALALIRPGAASIGMKEVFIRRSRGLEAAPPGHEEVDRILAETHGVMLYEDDVMLVASAIANQPLPEGDRFRKAVQKCFDDERRRELSREFLSRCREAGVGLDYAKGLWVQMAKFNAYSFCRAHAASYAMLGYAVAYLRTHYPLEFWIAALNNNQSMYHPRVYVEQAKREGIRFLPPDVNRSAAEFAPADSDAGAIRAGLAWIGGLGPASVETLLAERRRGGPYAGLGDLLIRTRLGREEARSLILCGALDFTGRPRPELMIELDLVLAARPNLPAGPRPLLPAEPTVPACAEDFSPYRKYSDQRRLLGFSTAEHILALYRPGLAAAGLVDADSRDLPSRIGRRVRLAGVLEAHRTTRTQNGRPMRFLTLDDEWGLFEATVFPDARDPENGYGHYGPYVVEGNVEEQYGSVTVNAEVISRPAVGRAKHESNASDPKRDGNLLAAPRA